MKIIFKGMINAVIFILMLNLFVPSVLFYSVYAYRSNVTLGVKKRWGVNLVTLITIIILNAPMGKNALTISLAFYTILLIPELILDFFLRFTNIKLTIIDLGVITAIIIAIVMWIIYNIYLREMININYQEAKVKIEMIFNMPKENLEDVINEMIKNRIEYLFYYAFGITMIFYLGVWNRMEGAIRYSYIFLIPYLIIFIGNYFLINTLGREITLLSNIISILKLTYIYNGIFQFCKKIENTYGRGIGRLSFILSVISVMTVNYADIIFMINGVHQGLNTPIRDTALDDYRNGIVKKLNL